MTRQLLVLAVALAAISGCAGGAGQGSGDFVEVPGIGQTRVDVPRPTSGAGAVCDADPFPPASEETIEERVAALRAIGLFADRPDLDDAALAAEVEAGIADVWGDTLEPDDPLLDLIVAQEDRQRVWWQDLEADVLDGNDVYVETLQGLAAISLGAFEPEGVRERWASGEGPVTITFSLADRAHEITPAYLEDWIDPGILVPINELIASAGRRFELYKSFDQTAFVMALTDAERQGLEARGWCFE
jgi:hypothetical protein